MIRILIVRGKGEKREKSPVTFPQGRQHLLQGTNILENVPIPWDKTEILKRADSGTYK